MIIFKFLKKFEYSQIDKIRKNIKISSVKVSFYQSLDHVGNVVNFVFFVFRFSIF